MQTKRILTIQDISCVGQCSLTVALPIISACGIETAILPAAILSTHTCGFSGYTCRDLTEDIPPIRKHWQKEQILFDGIYTGYLASAKQIEYVQDVIKTCIKRNAPVIVDPAMADNGKLYPAFDIDFVSAMKNLCSQADVILPNITEACFLTGEEYKSVYDEAYIDTLLSELAALGAKTIVLTGVGYDDSTTGVVVFENGNKQYYKHKKLTRSCHGTGDVFASAFTGAYMNGKSPYDCAKIAADFTVECIENTPPEHWYGVCFEQYIPSLFAKLN